MLCIYTYDNVGQWTGVKRKSENGTDIYKDGYDFTGREEYDKKNNRTDKYADGYLYSGYEEPNKSEYKAWNKKQKREYKEWEKEQAVKKGEIENKYHNTNYGSYTLDYYTHTSGIFCILYNLFSNISHN